MPVEHTQYADNTLCLWCDILRWGALRSCMSAQKQVPMGMNHMTVVPENFEVQADEEDGEGDEA
ncbi:MAG: hypothetical protein ACI8U4_002415 [Natronomonas sp.]|jgi:hypothetical protein